MKGLRFMETGLKLPGALAPVTRRNADGTIGLLERALMMS